MKFEYLAHKLFETDFLTNQNGDLIISLNYHKQLDENEFRQNAYALRELFKNENVNVNFVGRAKKQLILADTDTVKETIHTRDRDFFLFQVEGNFSQPNIYTCQNMVQFARDCCTNCSDEDLIELYCGSGTFTVCLSDLFRKVFSTEVSRVPALTCARNLEENHISNTKIARLSAVEVAEALDKVRQFKRLELAGIDVDDYKLTTLLIDPPRSGLEFKEALDFTARFDRVIYISCSPESLASDLAYLSQTHHIEKLAFFDQFPYTEHLESGCLLIKNE